MNEYEEFALGQFLSSCNDELTFQTIIDMLRSPESFTDEEIDNAEIAIWEPFEYHSHEWIADEIELFKESLERRFIPKENPA